MYLRYTTVRKNGKTHKYWRLVRSVRCGSKVQQETVACLGELDAQGRAKATLLAESICGRAHQGSFFEEGRAEESVQVQLRGVRVERGRRFGDVWMGWILWQALRLNELMERLLAEGREEVPWPVMVAVLVIARLSEPSSELHIAEDWFRRTALDSLLGISEEKINDDRLYRGLDILLPQKEEIEKHMRSRLGELFQIEYDLVLYDVTSTYFEGEAAGNAQAKRGYSRDHRPDCKQVCIALVVSKCGMPLGYEVFAGNRTDVTTLKEIVETVERKHGKADRIWVVDRGMISEENMEFLRQEGRRYIVGTPRGMLKKFERDLLAKDWQTIRDGLEVKVCPSSDGTETFIVCRSQDRREKEKAMHERFEKRIEEGLQKIKAACSKKRQDPVAISRRVGRLLGGNSRAAGLFAVEVEREADGCAKVVWKKKDAWREWAALSEGCYLLRSNLTDWTAEDLWKAYIQLTQAEAAFRIQKGDLEIRPIWHQKEERVQAHILVCFLAYALWKTLEKWQSQAGLGNSPATLLYELRNIQSTDVILPTTDGRELRIRCVVRPDKAQQDLLSRLGLTLPDRLRGPAGIAKM